MNRIAFPTGVVCMVVAMGCGMSQFVFSSRGDSIGGYQGALVAMTVPVLRGIWVISVVSRFEAVVARMSSLAWSVILP